MIAEHLLFDNLRTVKPKGKTRIRQAKRAPNYGDSAPDSGSGHRDTAVNQVHCHRNSI
jgi:hypothetical protein